MGVKGDSKAGAKSRRKGANFERETAVLFRKWWGDGVQRTPMSGAYGPEWELAGDLMFVDPPKSQPHRRWPFYVELRNRESWRLEQLYAGEGPVFAWLEETKGAAMKMDLLPMLIIHRAFVPALVCIRQQEIDGMRYAAEGAICTTVAEWRIMALDGFLATAAPEQVWRLNKVGRSVRAPDQPIDFT